MAVRGYYDADAVEADSGDLRRPGRESAIAFALFWLVLFVGSLSGALTLEGVNPGIQTLKPPTPVVGHVEHGMPAAAGLRPGDTIMAVDGHRVAGAPRSRRSPRIAARARWSKVASGAHRSRSRCAAAGRLARLSLVPQYSSPSQAMVLGLSFVAPAAKSFGVLAPPGCQCARCGRLTSQTFSGLAKALTS